MSWASNAGNWVIVFYPLPETKGGGGSGVLRAPARISGRATADEAANPSAMAAAVTRAATSASKPL
jgi:hypothetical protein